MNWEKAEKYGDGLVNDLKDIMGGDYTETNKRMLLKTHKFIRSNGGWTGYNNLNLISLNELEEILESKIKDGDRKKKKVKLEKDDETKHINVDDYIDLIMIAKELNDNEWEKDLIEICNSVV